MWKDFWYFSREEKRGIIVLAILIVIGIGTACFLSIHQTKSIIVDKEEFEKEYADFISSLKEREYPSAQRATKGSPDTYREKREITLMPFDPNSADSLTFLQLGLPPWMAKNILRYRAKGGTFRTPEDFRKVYSLTGEQYETLLPYIHIEEKFRKKESLPLFTEAKPVDTTIIFKYPEGTVLDLNLADTTELKKVPGIGSGIANRIVSYKKQLGGFYSVEQLQDIQFITADLNRWFRIEANELIPIHVNKASVDRLRSHPYINFYQAKVIFEYRKKKGSLKNIDQLKLYEEFTAKDLERIGHYLVFD